MKRRILLIIMCLICVLLTGCGSRGAERADKVIERPVHKKEAVYFDRTYRYEAEDLDRQLCREAEKICRKYGTTFKAYNEIPMVIEESVRMKGSAKKEDWVLAIQETLRSYRITYETWEKIAKEIAGLDGPARLSSLGQKTLGANGASPEVVDLQVRLKNYITATGAVWQALGGKGYLDLEELKNERRKEAYNYRSRLHSVVNGSSLYTMKSSAGEILARSTSNMFFGIAGIDERWERSGFLVDDMKGKFIELRVAISNGKTDPVAVRSDWFMLVDREGREYLAADNFFENGGNNILRRGEAQLAAKKSMEITVYFDVPRTLDAHEYYLRISGDFSAQAVDMPVAVNRTGY